MLIKALCDYADIKAASGSDEMSILYTEQDVNFRVILTSEGKISRIDDIRKKELRMQGKKEKEFLRPAKIKLPKRKSTSSIASHIIDHRPQYIFGLKPVTKNDKNYFCVDKDTGNSSEESETEDEYLENKKKEKKLTSHEAFINTNHEFCKDIDSEIVKAYCRFIETWDPEAEVENPILMRYFKEYTKSSFCFGLEGDINCKLEEDEKLLKKFAEMQSADINGEESPEEMMFCPIEEKVLKVASTHNKVRGVLNATSTGAGLVGMDKAAFESYEKEQSCNSGISKVAMLKYTTVLEKLLKDKLHHTYIGNTTIIHFALADNDESMCKDIMSMLKGSEEDRFNKNICAIMKQLQSGKTGDLSALGEARNTDFYIAGLTPNCARIAQSFCIKNSFGNIMQNVARHQIDIAMSPDGKPISLYALLKELVSPKSENEVVPSPVISSMFTAIINGTRYPRAVYETVLRRIKIDRDEVSNDTGIKNHYIKLNDRRVGLIKAYLNRESRIKKEREEITMSLDRTNTAAAYLCGRLFSVLEQIQSQAQGQSQKLNRTIKDSHFTLACSSPLAAFPQLIKMSQYHLRKLQRDGYALNIRYSKLTEEIINELHDEFPKHLSLEDQGRFIIGYYQQKSDIFTKKEKTSSENITEDISENNDTDCPKYTVAD